MKTTSFLKARVPESTKALVRVAATQAYLTEAAWFRRAIDVALRAEGSVDGERNMLAFRDRRSTKQNGAQRARIYIRLQREDRLILSERAIARGMPVATYASVLLRSHLRHLNPLPRPELDALKSAVGELRTIGRNLNQIARAANMGRAGGAAARADLDALLRVCEALRLHVKDLLKANLHSWAVGHADPQS